MAMAEPPLVGGEQAARNRGRRTVPGLLLRRVVVGAGPEQSKDLAISRQEECIWGPAAVWGEEEGGKEALSSCRLSPDGHAQIISVNETVVPRRLLGSSPALNQPESFTAFSQLPQRRRGDKWGGCWFQVSCFHITGWKKKTQKTLSKRKNQLLQQKQHVLRALKISPSSLPSCSATETRAEGVKRRRLEPG